MVFLSSLSNKIMISRIILKIRTHKAKTIKKYAKKFKLITFIFLIKQTNSFNSFKFSINYIFLLKVDDIILLMV